MMAELDDLQEIARLSTSKVLENYEIPDEWRRNLALSIHFENDIRIFELYVVGKRPNDAIVISRAKVDRRTKTVSVDVSNLEKK